MPQSINQKVATKQKQAQALSLRQEGHTYDEIARRVGFANAGGAYKAIRRALASIDYEEAQDLRNLQLERLEEFLRQLWPTAMDRRNPRQLQAMNMAITVMEKMNRLAGLCRCDHGYRSRRPANPHTTRESKPAVLVI